MGSQGCMNEEEMGTMISFNPVTPQHAPEDVKQQFLELQLKMVTNSINHEYARMELDDIKDFERQDELESYMHDCRCSYFEARSELASYDPYALAEFEADLIKQKQVMLSQYQA